MFNSLPSRCLLMFAALPAFAEMYTIAPAPNAKFALEVHKTGLYSGKVHVFEYADYAGKLDFDAARPEAAKMELTIKSASIVCKDTWIDEKDKKKVTGVAHDMMESAKHPELKFVSTGVTKRGDGFDVAGTLTIKGIAKPVIVNVMMKAEGAGYLFTGKATVMRKDYKINPPSPVPFGIIGNKEEMPVSFILVAKR